MARETPLDIASELEVLLQEEGHDSDSKSLSILSELQSAIRTRDLTVESEGADYTRSRAQTLRGLALKMDVLLVLTRGDDMTYADRAKTLCVVSDSYLKLAHAFKTDPKMWSLAQAELVPTLSQVSDEAGVDAALDMLQSHLETYLVSLDSWLGK